MGTSKFLHHGSCPSCGSSDALAVYDDGGEHCFSCGYHTKGSNGDTQVTEVAPKAVASVKMDGVVAAIGNRKLSKETSQRYQVTVTYDANGAIEKHYYPYYNSETGELVA